MRDRLEGAHSRTRVRGRFGFVIERETTHRFGYMHDHTFDDDRRIDAESDDDARTCEETIGGRTLLPIVGRPRRGGST